MLNFEKTLTMSLGLALCAFGLRSAAQADDDVRTITRSGVYVIEKNSHRSIVIEADNVTLDLNGHTLAGSEDKTGIGILVNGQQNVQIRNGIVTGFGTGVEVLDSHNVTVTDLQIDGADLGGPPPGEVGVMIVNSRGVKVTNNTITQTFLGVFVRGDGSSGNTVKANTITGGNNGQLAICYNPAMNADPSTDGPTGDLITANHISRFQLGIQTSAASTSSIFSDNYISYFSQDIQEVTPGSNLFQDNASTQLP